MCTRLGVLLVLALSVAGPASALDLGKIGPTYPVAERDFLVAIRERLLEKERTGEMATLMRQSQERAIQSVKSPTPVAGLSAAVAPRTHYFDPSVTLDRPIVDDKGRVLWPAGTRKNPLDVVSMSRALVFFDARDARQVRHARQLIANEQGNAKPVLVAGSYLDLMKRWQMPVYYDQEGTLVRKLGITAVPAIVRQEGSRLRIDQVVAQ